MKKLLLAIMVIGLVLPGISQKRMIPSKEMRDMAVRKQHPVQITHEFDKEKTFPAYKGSSLVEEEVIGNTRYDLQSNSSSQNRMYWYEDGTIGATWTMGFSDPAFPGRGTGYNYYDGADWGEIPTDRIESIRAGWPSYAPYGENGEMVVSHDFSAGDLLILTRDVKGTGAWSEMSFAGPADVPISWPRAITSGVDNSVMQVLAITWPTANGGPVYEDLDGALLYSRSSDGGLTWDPEHEILDGISSDDYVGFSADDYEWASQGDNIAFLLGSSWIDFILMKSTDGGDTWEKTVIWQNPYPFFNVASPTVTDTFYCVDGAHHLAFDAEGKVHVVFGINRAHSDGSGTFWFPLVDGLGYWNEDMPVFSDDLNALNPYGEAGTELTEDYNLIGWSQDINNNGEWDILGEVGAYYVGTSSMPQIIVDEYNRIFVVYASVTETFNNNVQDYRHIWARPGYGGAWADFVDLTSDLIHIFDECVFPSVSPQSDDHIYLMFQTDSEPGLAVRGDEDPYGDNNINFMKVLKTELITVGEDEMDQSITQENVSQNIPNPFNGSSRVQVELSETSDVKLEVTSMTGQTVYETASQKLQAGKHWLKIEASDLTAGVYFYTVYANGTKITKKMTVK